MHLHLLRRQLIGGEVVNADSMQLYQGLDIGTASLTLDERAGVPHHLLDIWPVTAPASVAEYQRLARAAIDDIFRRGRTPLLVGGSGLYVRAVLEKFDFPGTDPAVRHQLEQDLAEVGPEEMHRRLTAVDAALTTADLTIDGDVTVTEADNVTVGAITAEDVAFVTALALQTGAITADSLTVTSATPVARPSRVQGSHTMSSSAMRTCSPCVSSRRASARSKRASRN